MTIPDLPPQLERAANGTDPRGVLAFSAPLPEPWQSAEDSTQDADKRRCPVLGHKFKRAATAAEKELLRSIGYAVDDDLVTTVKWVSPGVRNRTWPTLEGTAP